MSWVKVKDFEKVLKEFKEEIEKADIGDLDWLDSGWLWWDEKHQQYVFLRIRIDDTKEGFGRLLWCGNGLTAYEGHIEFQGKEGLLNILDNIDEYF